MYGGIEEYERVTRERRNCPLGEIQGIHLVEMNLAPMLTDFRNSTDQVILPKPGI